MPQKERWASRLGLVLAMAGNAVGLGNFLRFPAQAAKNGGGAFMIPYIVALLVLGLPLIWVEWTMGRFGGRYGHHSSPGVFQSLGRSPIWKYFGVFGLWVNLVIAAYYLYIESWTLAYAGQSVLGGFPNKDSAPQYLAWLTGEQKNEIFAISGPGLVIFFVCVAINIWILSRGLAKGIEIVCKIGMPTLIVFATILAIRGLLIVPPSSPTSFGILDPAAVESPWVGLNYVWEPKFDSLLDSSVWLAAAGQIFFTLSIGMGSIHCYASYLRENDDVTLTGATAAWTNEFCEVVLGGTILVPIAVAYLGLGDAKEQFGLEMAFKICPSFFQKWGMLAPAAGFLWFGLLFFAAITSSLAMGQPIMAFLQSEFRMGRGQSAWIFGLLLMPLAIPVAIFHSATFFDEFDFWAGSFALVVFALLESILFAWVFGIDRGWQEMMKGAEIQVPRVFYYVMKYVTPVLLLVILVANTFEPAAGWDGYLRALMQGKPAPAWDWSGGGTIGKLLMRDVDAMQTKALAKLEKDRPVADPQNEVALKAFAQEQENTIAFHAKVRIWRNVDRIVMVATFLFFTALVSIAWKRRRAEGLHTEYTP